MERVGNALLSAVDGEQPPTRRRVSQRLGRSLPLPPVSETPNHLASRSPRDGTFQRLPGTGPQPPFTPLTKGRRSGVPWPTRHLCGWGTGRDGSHPDGGLLRRRGPAGRCADRRSAFQAVPALLLGDAINWWIAGHRPSSAGQPVPGDRSPSLRRERGNGGRRNEHPRLSHGSHSIYMANTPRRRAEPPAGGLPSTGYGKTSHRSG